MVKTIPYYTSISLQLFRIGFGLVTTQIESISRFLIKKTLPDLAKMYNQEMEVQVNVKRADGEKYEGEFNGKRWTGWTDGIQIWKSFRIPMNAKSEPVYDLQKEIKFDVFKYVESIGMTGWNWKKRTSKWVAFDFDAIIGHSEKHTLKLSNQQLNEIENVVRDINWVTLRYSTSGKGLHLYVYLNDIPTSNHTEHAALARSILGNLSAMTGYDFKSKVDICGGNMWVYHDKMIGTNGLQLIKQGDVFTDIQPNWRDHIEVVSGKRKRLTPKFIEKSELPDIERMFEELSGQRSRTQLDDEHKALIKYLQDNNCSWWWDQDHHMLVCHTYDLKCAHSELGLKGVFETISEGKEKGIDHNAFAYPLKNGGWVVRRYSPGVKEEKIWDQDGSGWTRCYYNVNPTFDIACRIKGGIEDPIKGGYIFQESGLAEQATAMLGASLDLPNHMKARETKIKVNKDGRLLIEVKHETNDNPNLMPGWVQQKDKWLRLFYAKNSEQLEPKIGNYDDIVRHLITEENENFGWVIKTDGQWRIEPLKHVEKYLISLGLKDSEVSQIIGSGIHRPWTLVNQPFQLEYPGNRQWNKKSAQLRFTPTVDTDNLKYPMWSRIINHCGSSLDEALINNQWAKSNGITTGGEYLKCWIASIFQHPTEPLPYLFFFGDQGSGKSIFHEAFTLLVTGGVVNAGQAIESSGGFNAEIEHAVLCYIEEKDLNRNKMAYQRIKDWVTARNISIHKKGQTPYTIINTTHWIQCGNNRDYCPIFPGDTRITVIYVPPLDSLIPKSELLRQLEKEAPDFLAAVTTLEIPKSNDRLYIPVIETEDKVTAVENTKTILEMFIEQKCFYCPGSMVTIAEFYSAFKSWMMTEMTLDESEMHSWTKIKVGRHLPRQYPKGRNTANADWCIGNISFEQRLPMGPELIVINKMLKGKTK